MTVATRLAPLPCLVCGQMLEPAMSAGLHRSQPYGAVTFYSYGQYGSTVFDPQDESKLDVNICDACLVAAATVGRVWVSRDIRRAPLTLLSMPWHPSIPGDPASADGDPDPHLYPTQTPGRLNMTFPTGRRGEDVPGVTEVPQ